MHAENHYLHRRLFRLQVPEDLEPSPSGHRDVHDGDVEVALPHEIQHLLSARRFSPHHHPGAFRDDLLQALADDAVIVDEQNPDHASAPRSFTTRV
jgi:hypothetical protein